MTMPNTLARPCSIRVILPSLITRSIQTLINGSTISKTEPRFKGGFGSGGDTMRHNRTRAILFSATLLMVFAAGSYAQDRMPPIPSEKMTADQKQAVAD